MSINIIYFRISMYGAHIFSDKMQEPVAIRKILLYFTLGKNHETMPWKKSLMLYQPLELAKKAFLQSVPSSMSGNMSFHLAPYSHKKQYFINNMMTTTPTTYMTCCACPPDSPYDSKLSHKLNYQIRVKIIMWHDLSLLLQISFLDYYKATFWSFIFFHVKSLYLF
jgi:hypothetical protein